jgi:sulfatase modifying factor 1
MSTSASITFRSESEADYAADGRGSFEKIARQNRRPQYRRTGTAPGSVNGMHRRRQTRWTWGHGRGARLENLRSLARVIIAATATMLATSATAAPISLDFVEVGSPGNAANTNGRGAVNYVFQIQDSEVTNAQYVAFLNSVDPNGTNPNGVFNASMSSSFRGGILNSGSTPGAIYSAKNGMGQRPVNFVSWYDAARFVNWVQTGGVNTETGTYDLASATPTVRLPGAQFWLPSEDEWYKAAFYNPSTTSYNDYATGSNVNPSAPALTVGTLAGTGPLQGTILNPSPTTVVYANQGVVVGTVAEVKSAGSSSSFGAFDMNGNVFEFTDTAVNGSQVLMYGGGYGQALSVMGALSPTNNLPVSISTYENQGVGFRIAAVPEPSTIAMVITGAIVCGGLQVRRRVTRRLANSRAAIAA